MVVAQHQDILYSVRFCPKVYVVKFRSVFWLRAVQLWAKRTGNSPPSNGIDTVDAVFDKFMYVRTEGRPDELIYNLLPR